MFSSVFQLGLRIKQNLEDNEETKSILVIEEPGMEDIETFVEIKLEELFVKILGVVELTKPLVDTVMEETERSLVAERLEELGLETIKSWEFGVDVAMKETLFAEEIELEEVVAKILGVVESKKPLVAEGIGMEEAKSWKLVVDVRWMKETLVAEQLKELVAEKLGVVKSTKPLVAEDTVMEETDTSLVAEKLELKEVVAKVQGVVVSTIPLLAEGIRMEEIKAWDFGVDVEMKKAKLSLVTKKLILEMEKVIMKISKIEKAMVNMMRIRKALEKGQRKKTKRLLLSIVNSLSQPEIAAIAIPMIENEPSNTILIAMYLLLKLGALIMASKKTKTLEDIVESMKKVKRAFQMAMVKEIKEQMKDPSSKELSDKLDETLEQMTKIRQTQEKRKNDCKDMKEQLKKIEIRMEAALQKTSEIRKGQIQTRGRGDGPTQHARPGMSSNTTQNARPGMSSNTTQQRPGMSSNTTQHARPGMSSNTTQHARPGMSSNTTQHARPGMSSNTTQHARPGMSSNTTQHARPGMSSNTTQHARPGMSSNPTQHARPGMSSNTTQHARPGMSSNRTQHARPGMSSNTTQHARPGMSSNTTQHARPGMSSLEKDLDAIMLAVGEMNSETEY
ncbi:hypothetical protein WDU94_010875 [Cyamophila willieti]